MYIYICDSVNLAVLCIIFVVVFTCVDSCTAFSVVCTNVCCQRMLHLE